MHISIVGASKSGHVPSLKSTPSMQQPHDTHQPDVVGGQLHIKPLQGSDRVAPQPLDWVTA
jgi:hypothetical protein